MDQRDTNETADDDANFGVVLSQAGEYVFICVRPYLNENGMYQAAASAKQRGALAADLQALKARQVSTASG